MVSANYWRKAVYGPRRNLDLLVSRSSLCCFLVAEAMRPNPRWPLASIMLALLATFYRASFALHARHSVLWIRAHLFFHASILASFYLVLV